LGERWFKTSGFRIEDLLLGALPGATWGMGTHLLLFVFVLDPNGIEILLFPAWVASIIVSRISLTGAGMYLIVSAILSTAIGGLTGAGIYILVSLMRRFLRRPFKNAPS
jgi:hypothetical protein